MHTHAVILYEPFGFILSIIAAIMLSIFALWVKFKIHRYFPKLANSHTSILAGSILGAAITAMHYIGMAAARLISLPGEPPIAPDTTDLSSQVLFIGGATLIISSFVLVGNLLLRYRELNGQLMQSESRIRAIVETAVDGIISIDGRGRIVAMNGAAEKLFGWTLDEVLYKNINILMPEPFHSQHDTYLANYFAGNKPKIIGIGREVVAKRKDGSLVPIRLAVGKADLPDQHLFVGFVSDISARIEMEREILARETQYRTLISNIPGVAFRVEATPPWRTIFVSDGITTLSGWTPEIFTQHKQSLATITHPDDYLRVRSAIYEALRLNEPYTIEFRMIDRHGQEHWVSQSASCVVDPTTQAKWIDGVIVDITDTKRRNAEFEGIVRSIGRSLLFVEFDLKGQVLDANRNFLELVGLDHEELLDLKFADLICVHELPAEQDEFWQKLEAGEFYSGEYCLKGCDGRRIWMQATFNPILDSDGKTWKVVALGNDLSQRKAMETDLFIAKNKAEQAATAKGLFLANMSHEIRTPMNAIIGFTEVLLDSPLAPTQRKQLKTIHQSARSLLGLLNDILDTAKLERGAVELELAGFSLRQLIEDIAQEQRLGACKKGLELLVDFADDTGDWVQSDALRVRQILVNLLGNAIKFTEKGEVVLRVRRRNERVIIKIIDTGIGIPSDRLAHIFTPFTQADASMARRFGGTGLGTTIARQLAELMGGSISAASIEGKGSTFTLELPLSETEALINSKDRQEEPLPPLRVLIADDVPENLELLELILAREGHRVVSASDGNAAFDAFLREPFDLVLMDVQMPNLDGLDATLRIREWEAANGRPATPIIALTASVLERDRIRAAASGMNGFASKPINVVDLFAEIRRCLSLKSIDTVTVAATETPVIDWQNAESRWGDAALLREKITRFTQSLPPMLEALASDPATRQAKLHQLKGTAGNLGLSALSQQLAEAESATQDEAFTRQLRVLKAQMDAIFKAIDGMVPASTPSTDGEIVPLDTSVKAEDMREQLAALVAAFNQGEIDESRMEAARRVLPADIYRSVSEAADNFDLMQAAALLDNWLTHTS
ncbi:MAG: PAS domain S-box protein [Cellvibrio sp.]